MAQFSMEITRNSGSLLGGNQQTLTNPSKNIAFFVRAELHKDKESGEILPIIYEDNYVTVYPGETRQITARIAKEKIGGQQPLLVTEGYNLN